MATRRLYPGANQTLPLVKATAQDARTSNAASANDPVVIGQIPGVALIDVTSSACKTVVQTDGIWDLLVAGINQSGNSAVAGGDAVYFVAGDNPPLSKKNTGILFGYAVGDAGVTLVASAGTTTRCPVKVGK